MKVNQLTDFHLFENQEEKLHNYCTYECLKLVIDHIIYHHCMNADAVFVTGDVSQDGSSGSYYLALMQLSRMNIPLCFISGNHDAKFIMKSVLKESPLVYCSDMLYAGNWKFINVDTVQEGKDSGFLSIKQRLNTEQDILNNNGMKVALFMHHHPVPVGIPLVDECMLMNSMDVLSLCDSHHQIKAIACGHAHTDYTEIYNECVIDVCPATCFQWCKGATDIKTENKRGFKVLEFTDDYKSETFFI